MADVTLSYKGSDILELSDSGSATLKTGGKYCEDDVTVEYVKPSGGDTLEAYLSNNLEAYSNSNLTSIPAFAMYRQFFPSTGVAFSFPNVTRIGQNAFYLDSTIASFFAPKAVFAGESVFRGASLLATPVFGAPGGAKEVLRSYTSMSLTACDFARTNLTNEQKTFGAQFFGGCTNFNTLILRDEVVYTIMESTFQNTPFASGGTGGTVYIPESIYNHLGDGTALDYKSATNWSVIDGYGTITWAKIEGSTYETHYADGTVIE